MKRRFFLAGTAGLIAMPAVVRAESLMRIVAPRATMGIDLGTHDTGVVSIFFRGNHLLMTQQITREAVLAWKNHNGFIHIVDDELLLVRDGFGEDNKFRIQLPPDWKLS